MDKTPLLDLIAQTLGRDHAMTTVGTGLTICDGKLIVENPEVLAGREMPEIRAALDLELLDFSSGQYDANYTIAVDPPPPMTLKDFAEIAERVKKFTAPPPMEFHHPYCKVFQGCIFCSCGTRPMDRMFQDDLFRRGLSTMFGDKKPT